MFWLILTILFPALCAVILKILPGKNGEHRFLCLFTGASLLLECAFCVLACAAGDLQATFLTIGADLPLVLASDPLSRFFALFFTVMWTVPVFYSFSYMAHDGHEKRYLMFYLLTLSALEALALSDMAIYERLTPAWLAGVLPALNAAALVVLDANLPAESIAYLAENCASPLFADPVSAAKAPRMRAVLPRLHTLKPNRLEAEILSGVPVTDEASALRAADRLLSSGVRRVFLSLGPGGVLAAEGDQRLLLPNPPQKKRENASGCGDAFMAALAWAALRGAGLRESALCGLTAAAVAMESAETVHPGMSAGLIRSRMECFYHASSEPLS